MGKKCKGEFFNVATYVLFMEYIDTNLLKYEFYKFYYFPSLSYY